MKLYKPISGFIKRNFSRKKSYQNFFQLLQGFAVSSMNYGHGSKFWNSGEIEVLKYISSRIDTNIIFDVGANVGNYAKNVSKYLHGKIYCFEPAASIFKKLKANTIDDNFNCYQLALSDMQGEATFYSRKLNHEIGSLIHTSSDNYGDTITETVATTTLDNFCSINNISHIDFLKIDVEGNELNVLKGARQMLRNKKIRFIQFEFGRFSMDSRIYFRDFWQLLHEDYAVYRIVKDGLFPIRQYTTMLEIFESSNFIAELRNDLSLRE
jgi:FkbM family methyltransferase